MKRMKVSKKSIKNFLECCCSVYHARSSLISNEGSKFMFTDNTIISIDPSTQTVEQGETFVVSVYVEPGEPRIGVNFDYLYFDPTLIHVNSITEGNLFDPYNTFFYGGTIDNVNGMITSVYGLTWANRD